MLTETDSRLFALRDRRRAGRHRRQRERLGAEHRGRGALLGNVQGRAERHTGGFGINFRLAARIGDGLLARLVEQFRGLRHREIDVADIIGTGGDQCVDHACDLGDVAHLDGDAVAGTIADDRCGAGAVRRILWLQRQARGLEVLLLDPRPLQRQQDLAHGGIVGVRRLARSLAVGGDPGVDLREVRRHRDRAFAGDGNRRRKIALRRRGRHQRQCGGNGRNKREDFDSSDYFSGT